MFQVLTLRAGQFNGFMKHVVVTNHMVFNSNNPRCSTAASVQWILKMHPLTPLTPIATSAENTKWTHTPVDTSSPEYKKAHRLHKKSQQHKATGPVGSEWSTFRITEKKYKA